MTCNHPRAQRSRRRLLIGGALAALSASIAVPALAVSPSAEIDGVGDRIIAKDQANRNAIIEATATDPVVEAVIEPTESTATLSANSIAASATANQQSNTLELDTLDLSSSSAGSHLATGFDGVMAYAPVAIAGLQVSEDAPVTADADFTYLGMTADGVVESKLTIADNRQEALARSNVAASSLGLSGNGASAGGGIVSQQSVDFASDVSANMAGQARMIAQEVVRSDLAIDDNVQRAIGSGNSTTNDLAVNTLAIEAPYAGGMPSIVIPDGETEVRAGFSVLSDQHIGGVVDASSDGGFRAVLLDSVFASSVSAKGNTLVAGAYGNEADNSAALASNSIGGGFGSGSVANVTTVQRADGPTAAATQGGATIILSSDLVDSSILAAGNQVQSIATANRADGNLLVVDATSISAPEGYGGEEVGEYVGTAMVTPFGELTVTAPFSVQNAQTFSAPVTATASSNATRVNGEMGIVGSSISLTDNDTRVAATGNSAESRLVLDATSIATAADLNSAQFGYGDVQASIADAEDLAGSRIVSQDEIVDSRLDITGNDTQASATSNSVSNTLAVTGNQFDIASGHWNARAGSSYGEFSASADYALASFQAIEGSENLSHIAADISGRLAASGNGVVNSTISIEGNSQNATALANLASNALLIDATALGSEEGYAPGSALSSTQIGAAELWASSDLVIDATGDAVDASVLIRDNSNVALAHMNDASNQASISAVRIGELSGFDAELYADPLQPGFAVGDHVLANSQLAEGNVAAVAVTDTHNPDEAAVLSRSNYAVVGNRTAAEAVANQAINSLSVAAASSNESSAGLLNVQESDADVLARADTQISYGGSALSDAQATLAGNVNSAVARGNTASNALRVDGTPASELAMASTWLNGLEPAHAPAVLGNAQINMGDVTARSESGSHAVALNAIGAEGSQVFLNGNSSSASAIGNNSNNSLSLASAGRLAAAAVVSRQTNGGQISAEVSGATLQAMPGALTAGRLGITGNVVSASAVGNNAVNTIASLR